MRRFLKKIFLFVLPLLIGGMVMEIVLRSIPNDYRNKRKYLDTHAPDIETLILGSSHALYGLNPGYFSTPAFNAAHVSQTLDQDAGILEKYEGQWRSLKAVILPISYFTLFERLSEGPEAWRIKNYVIYYGIRNSASPIDYTEMLSNRLRVNGDRIASYYIRHEPSLACDSLGWDTLHTAAPVADLVAAGKASAFRHTVPNPQDKSNIILLRQNLGTLDRIVSWCRERNVQLILFTPPAYSSYRENLDPVQLQVTVNAAEKLAAAHANVSYNNFMFDNTFRENDFYDGDHLSVSGARKLSQKIDRLSRAVENNP